MDTKQNEAPEEQPQPEVKKIEVVKPKPPPAKQYYTVKMEITAPATLEYKILAESPEQALEIATKASPGQFLVSPPKPNLSRMKKLKANIYLAGTTLIKLTKNF